MVELQKNPVAAGLLEAGVEADGRPLISLFVRVNVEVMLGILADDDNVAQRPEVIYRGQ